MVGEPRLRVAQLLAVRPEHAELDCVDEPVGRVVGPALDRFRCRKSVERVVQFDGVEQRCVVLEPATLWEPFRIDHATPIAITPPRTSDSHGGTHASPRTRSGGCRNRPVSTETRLATGARGYDGTMATKKRELIEPHADDKRFIRRDDDGKIAESKDVGRSLAKDVRQHAEKTVKSGQGDRGDRGRSK